MIGVGIMTVNDVALTVIDSTIQHYVTDVKLDLDSDKTQ